jgi:hypothetical protein
MSMNAGGSKPELGETTGLLMTSPGIRDAADVSTCCARRATSSAVKLSASPLLTCGLSHPRRR